MRLARASGRPEREVDVQATLGASPRVDGPQPAGSGRAGPGSGGLARRAGRPRAHAACSVLWDLGRFHEAHQDLSRALPYFRRAGDTVWEARSLTHRAEVFLGLGLPGRAGRGLRPGRGDVLATSGQELEYAKARHNRGLTALIRGDLPEALTYFDEAGNRYDALGETNPELAIDRCSALLAAGLAAEAAQETDTALSRLPPEGGIAYRKAELLFAAATAALAAGNPADARQRARQARRQFQTQRRALWEARASLVLAEARYAAGEHSPALLRYAEEVAARLDASRAGEAMQAHLLAGRIALSRGSVTASRPAPGARRAVPPPRAAAAPERGLAGPGPAGRRAGQRPGHRRGLRAAVSTRSRSTRCGSGPPSCARTARRTAPSSPRWPSATRSGAATSAGCCSGASDGGRPRWPPGAHRSGKTRS